MMHRTEAQWPASNAGSTVSLLELQEGQGIEVAFAAWPAIRF